MKVSRRINETAGAQYLLPFAEYYEPVPDELGTLAQCGIMSVPEDIRVSFFRYDQNDIFGETIRWDLKMAPWRYNRERPPDGIEIARAKKTRTSAYKVCAVIRIKDGEISADQLKHGFEAVKNFVDSSL